MAFPRACLVYIGTSVKHGIQTCRNRYPSSISTRRGSGARMLTAHFTLPGSRDDGADVRYLPWPTEALGISVHRLNAKSFIGPPAFLSFKTNLTFANRIKLTLDCAGQGGESPCCPTAFIIIFTVEQWSMLYINMACFWIPSILFSISTAPPPLPPESAKSLLHTYNLLSSHSILALASQHDKVSRASHQPTNAGLFIHT